jgi:hypothetical protein
VPRVTSNVGDPGGSKNPFEQQAISGPVASIPLAPFPTPPVPPEASETSSNDSGAYPAAPPAAKVVVDTNHLKIAPPPDNALLDNSEPYTLSNGGAPFVTTFTSAAAQEGSVSDPLSVLPFAKDGTSNTSSNDGTSGILSIAPLSAKTFSVDCSSGAASSFISANPTSSEGSISGASTNVEEFATKEIDLPSEDFAFRLDDDFPDDRGSFIENFVASDLGPAASAPLSLGSYAATSDLTQTASFGLDQTPLDSVLGPSLLPSFTAFSINDNLLTYSADSFGTLSVAPAALPNASDVTDGGDPIAPATGTTTSMPIASINGTLEAALVAAFGERDWLAARTVWSNRLNGALQTLEDRGADDSEFSNEIIALQHEFVLMSVKVFIKLNPQKTHDSINKSLSKIFWHRLRYKFRVRAQCIDRIQNELFNERRSARRLAGNDVG